MSGIEARPWHIHVPTHRKVGNLCSIPIAERRYVSRQSTPTLSPFEVDRAYDSLLQNVQVRFSGSSWPMAVRECIFRSVQRISLRNLGIEILVFVLIRLWFGGNPEPTKMVVKKSCWVAFSRCLIHTLPVAVSLVLLRLSLGGLLYRTWDFSGDLTA